MVMVSLPPRPFTTKPFMPVSVERSITSALEFEPLSPKRLIAEAPVKLVMEMVSRPSPSLMTLPVNASTEPPVKMS